MEMLPSPSLLTDRPTDRFTEVFGDARGAGRPDASFDWTSGEGKKWTIRALAGGHMELVRGEKPHSVFWSPSLRKLCECLCSPIHEACLLFSSKDYWTVTGEVLTRLRLWAAGIAAEELAGADLPEDQREALESFVEVMDLHSHKLAATQARVEAARAKQLTAEAEEQEALSALHYCMKGL